MFLRKTIWEPLDVETNPLAKGRPAKRIRTIVFWGLYEGPDILGNYYLGDNYRHLVQEWSPVKDLRMPKHLMAATAAHCVLFSGRVRVQLQESRRVTLGSKQAATLMTITTIVTIMISRVIIGIIITTLGWSVNARPQESLKYAEAKNTGKSGLSRAPAQQKILFLECAELPVFLSKTRFAMEGVADRISEF